MVRLQRRTTLLCTALIAFTLAAGALGFVWYTANGMALLGRAAPTSARPAIEYGFVWGQVYLAALAAGVALICFAAEGTRIRCSAAVFLAASIAPPAAFLIIELAGA
jgi:hypothetical protein